MFDSKFKIWFQNRRAKFRRNEKCFTQFSSNSSSNKNNIIQSPNILESKNSLCQQLFDFNQTASIDDTNNTISNLISKTCYKYFAFNTTNLATTTNSNSANARSPSHKQQHQPHQQHQQQQSISNKNPKQYPNSCSFGTQIDSDPKNCSFKSPIEHSSADSAKCAHINYKENIDEIKKSTDSNVNANNFTFHTSNSYPNGGLDYHLIPHNINNCLTENSCSKSYTDLPPHSLASNYYNQSWSQSKVGHYGVQCQFYDTQYDNLKKFNVYAANDTNQQTHPAGNEYTTNGEFREYHFKKNPSDVVANFHQHPDAIYSNVENGDLVLENLFIENSMFQNKSSFIV